MTTLRKRFSLDEAMTFNDLVEHGRAELATHYDEIDIDDRPIGGKTIDVVIMDDFYINPKLCLRHVLSTGRSLHILCADGTLCSLLEKLYPRRKKP